MNIENYVMFFTKVGGPTWLIILLLQGLFYCGLRFKKYTKYAFSLIIIICIAYFGFYFEADESSVFKKHELVIATYSKHLPEKEFTSIGNIYKYSNTIVKKETMFDLDECYVSEISYNKELTIYSNGNSGNGIGIIFTCKNPVNNDMYEDKEVEKMFFYLNYLILDNEFEIFMIDDRMSPHLTGYSSYKGADLFPLLGDSKALNDKFFEMTFDQVTFKRSINYDFSEAGYNNSESIILDTSVISNAVLIGRLEYNTLDIIGYPDKREFEYIYYIEEEEK